jgi:molybdenum cofactor cytidylyltransferase
MPHGGAVLLAAGFSRRFGSDKRRHVLADGTPLLVASLRLYAAAFAEVLVVLRPEDETLAGMAATDARVILAPDAALGMGHSLARGAAAAAGWDYLFVALGDMAWVRPATLAALRHTMEGSTGDRIVQPWYQGTPGHPVGFAGRHQAALTELQGDQGARRVVRAAADDLIRLDVDDPGILEDLDTPP